MKAKIIQAGFKGFKVRKSMKEQTTQNDELPNLCDKDVQAATLKIQAGFKGFKVRQEMKKKAEAMPGGDDELPDLNDKDVQAAAVKIQAGFKGFKVRRDVQKVSTRDVAQALQIRPASGKVLETKKPPATPNPSIDFDNIPPPALEVGTSNSNFKPLPPAAAATKLSSKSVIEKTTTKLTTAQKLSSQQQQPRCGH